MQFGEIGNSLPVSKGTFQFSTRDKAVDSHLRLCRSWENFISPNLLGHSWEIGMYLLGLVKNFQLLHSQLWPSYGGIIPFSKIGGEIAYQLDYFQSQQQGVAVEQ